MRISLPIFVIEYAGRITSAVHFEGVLAVIRTGIGSRNASVVLLGISHPYSEGAKAKDKQCFSPNDLMCFHVNVQLRFSSKCSLQTGIFASKFADNFVALHQFIPWESLRPIICLDDCFQASFFFLHFIIQIQLID